MIRGRSRSICRNSPAANSRNSPSSGSNRRAISPGPREPGASPPPTQLGARQAGLHAPSCGSGLDLSLDRSWPQ